MPERNCPRRDSMFVVLPMDSSPSRSTPSMRLMGNGFPAASKSAMRYAGCDCRACHYRNPYCDISLHLNMTAPEHLHVQEQFTFIIRTCVGRERGTFIRDCA